MKRITPIFITLIVSIALMVTIMDAVVSRRDDYYTAKFHRRIPQLMKHYEIPGVAMLLVQRDAVWSKGYGLADKEEGVPVAARDGCDKAAPPCDIPPTGNAPV